MPFYNKKKSQDKAGSSDKDKPRLPQPSYNLHPIEGRAQNQEIRDFFLGIDKRSLGRIVPSVYKSKSTLYADDYWRIDRQKSLPNNYVFQLQLQKNNPKKAGNKERQDDTSTSYIIIFISHTWLEKTDRSITNPDDDEPCGAIIRDCFINVMDEYSEKPAYRYIDQEGKWDKMDWHDYHNKENDAWNLYSKVKEPSMADLAEGKKNAKVLKKSLAAKMADEKKQKKRGG